MNSLGNLELTQAPSALQVVIDFWKHRSTQMEQSIQEWVADGFTEITSFVSWNLLESDVTHQLYRFALGVVEAGLRLNLVVTPEPGLDLPNSGLPREWGTPGPYSARNARGQVLAVAMGPNAYAVPSLSDPEVQRRYQNYLKKLEGLLSDLHKANPDCVNWIELWIGSSYFSLYDLEASSVQGSFSSSQIEEWLNSGEFCAETAESKFRMRERHGHYLKQTYLASQIEALRLRTLQAVQKKRLGFKCRLVKALTPEAMPALQTLQVLSAMDPYALSESVGLQKFLGVIDHEMKHLESFGSQLVAPMVRFTGLGLFHRLSDPEKQHLLLRSLLKAAPLGGSLMIDWNAWKGFSEGFKNRIRSIGRMASQGELSDTVDVLYWSASHRTESGTEFSDELRLKCPEQCAWVSEPGRAQVRRDAKLLIADSSVLIAKGHVEELLSFAQGGRVVAIPAKDSMSMAAKRLLIERLKSAPCVSLNHGCALQVFAFGAGEVVLYDPPKESAESLFTSLLNLAKVSRLSTTSDDRLELLNLRKFQSDSSYAVFIMNKTPQAVSGDLRFSSEVSISDLALGSSHPFGHPDNAADSTAWARKFSLEVPPFGILPVEVNWVGHSSERKQAEVHSEIGLKYADDAAHSELPGLEQSNMEGGIS